MSSDLRSRSILQRFPQRLQVLCWSRQRGPFRANGVEGRTSSKQPDTFHRDDREPQPWSRGEHIDSHPALVFRGRPRPPGGCVQGKRRRRTLPAVLERRRRSGSSGRVKACRVLAALRIIVSRYPTGVSASSSPQSVGWAPGRAGKHVESRREAGRRQTTRSPWSSFA